MKTAVVSKTELDTIVELLDDAAGSLTGAGDSLLMAGELEEAQYDVDIELTDTNVDLSRAIDLLKAFQDQFESDETHSPQSEISEVSFASKRKQSKNALLSALNSLEAVRGHDELARKKNNKTEVPISGSDLQTIRAVIESAVALHDIQPKSDHPWKALSELNDFLKLTHEEIKKLAARGTAVGILYMLAKVLFNAIEKLSELLATIPAINV